MTSVTKHFKEINNRKQHVYVSDIAKSNCHILQFLHQMFSVSALLLDDAVKPATPLTNGAINEMLRHTLDISQCSVATHLRYGGIFSDNIIANCLLFLRVK